MMPRLPDPFHCDWKDLPHQEETPISYCALLISYLVIKAPWLFPKVSGGPEILQALGLAQRLQRCLHVEAAEDIF